MLGGEQEHLWRATSEEIDEWLAHWGKRANGPNDSLLVVKMIRARRNALHEKVNQLMRRRAEILRTSAELRNRENKLKSAAS